MKLWPSASRRAGDRKSAKRSRPDPSIRSDNGPQMSSNRFYFYLKNLEKKLTHEFIPPRSPDRNAYIEAFNSILETEVLKVQY